MTIASVAGIVYKIGWYFYALGPQMVICLLLGYLAARKSAGDLLTWLLVAFAAALLPLVGVVIMLALWWRAGTAPPAGAPGAAEPPA
jgi:hypothetical protein